MVEGYGLKMRKMEMILFITLVSIGWIFFLNILDRCFPRHVKLRYYFFVIVMSK